MLPRFDLHPDTRQRLCPITAGILTAALSATLAAAITGADTPYRIGLLVLIAAATALVALRTGYTARMIEKARQDGYDQGYSEGRRVAKPVVLKSAETSVKFREQLGLRGCRENLSQPF